MGAAGNKRCDLVENRGVNGRMLLTLRLTDGVCLTWHITREALGPLHGISQAQPTQTFRKKKAAVKTKKKVADKQILTGSSSSVVTEQARPGFLQYMQLTIVSEAARDVFFGRADQEKRILSCGC